MIARPSLKLVPLAIKYNIPPVRRTLVGKFITVASAPLWIKCTSNAETVKNMIEIRRLLTRAIYSE